ncbi:hypothetical protein [Streptomyces sp. NPDC095817]|uniref:hypothetical protein n=1 Tax=Streptomyces sp. NPDC095817 TaxID=3155082 RepID=UPI00331D75F1
MKPAAEVLTDLAQATNIAVHSSRALCGEVDTATAQDDKKRDEKELKPLRRKPTLQGVPAEQFKGFRRAPWQLLHSSGVVSRSPGGELAAASPSTGAA